MNTSKLKTAAAVALVALTSTVAHGSIVIQAPTANVMDVFLTESVDREPVCILRIKVGSQDSTNPWRAFKSNKEDDFSTLIFCMSRLIGDCTTTHGHDTVPVLIGGHIVQAQDIIGWILEDPNSCP